MSARNKSPKTTVSRPAIRVRSAASAASMFPSYSSFDAPGEMTTSSSGSLNDSACQRSSVRRTPCMLIRSYSAVTVVRSAATPVARVAPDRPQRERAVFAAAPRDEDVLGHGGASLSSEAELGAHEDRAPPRRKVLHLLVRAIEHVLDAP